MIWHRHHVWKRAIAMLCMAIGFMLANQTFISLMDRFEHLAQHEHAPNPLAGAVHWDDADHDHDDHQDHCAGPRHLCGPGDNLTHDGLTHHHHGDAQHLFLTAEPAKLFAAPAGRIFASGPGTPAGFEPGGPDHPPKA